MGWTLTRLPLNCECGVKFDLEHALSSKKVSFVSLRHNPVRNVTTILLNEACKDVWVEPQLEQLTGEYLQPSAAGRNEVCLNISAWALWQGGRMAFFDLRVFNPTSKRYANQELSKTYEINEKKKKRRHNERILQVKHGGFTPLVMSITGGMSCWCKKFYSRLV